MPLQTGTWTTNSAGSLGKLTITSVDTQGNLSASFDGAEHAIGGFWDEAAQKITFHDVLGQQVYTGFLFRDTFRMPGITGSTVFTLAGHFTDFTASADKPIFGWYAQIGVA